MGGRIGRKRQTLPMRQTLQADFDLGVHVFSPQALRRYVERGGRRPSASAAVPSFQRLRPSPDGRCCRSEENTSELQSLMRISYAVFCLKNKKNTVLQTHKKLNYKRDIHNSITQSRSPET